MPEMTETRTQITGLILAGGRAQRMGGQDKGLLPLAGQPLVAHVIAALAPQVCDIVINANRNAEAYSSQGYRVFADAVGGYCGPLAGIESGLGLAATPYLLSVPCDSPFLPPALGQRLYAALPMRTPRLRWSTTASGCNRYSRSSPAVCDRLCRVSSRVVAVKSTAGTRSTGLRLRTSPIPPRPLSISTPRKSSRPPKTRWPAGGRPRPELYHHEREDPARAELRG